MHEKSGDLVRMGSAALLATSVSSLLALLANPGSALAACSISGVDPVTVNCAANTSTANSTNNASPNAASSDRIQSFNADLTGQINGGVTVDTFGLNLVTTKADGGIVFTNIGAVTSSQNVNALQLDGNGGAVTYGGTGTVTNTGAGNGLNLSNIGTGAITATSSGAITTTAGHGIYASGVDGLITVNGQGAIDAFGGNGIEALSTGTGGITVSTTAAGTINSNRRGIWARSSGTAGNITVTTAGVIGGGVPVGGNGIEAGITNTASAGTISITANANVTSLADGISVQSLSTGGLTISGSGDISARGRGIYARQFNNAAGTNAGVHVGGTGDTTANFAPGISALITGANNTGAVLVDRTGNVSGTDGIVATTSGGGNVTVTGVGNVDGGTGTGINAASSGGNGNVVVAPAGSVTGAVGIVAWATGTGTATVTAGGAVTSTAGHGIAATGVDGLITVNGQGAINASGGVGIQALSAGTGGITVSTNAAGTINSSSLGILAQSSGTAGNITVTTAGVIGGGTSVGGRGIEASITNSASAGTISITANANVTSTNDGIFALSSGTGAITATSSGAITTTAGHGIYASGVDGLITVNGQGAIDAFGGNGIEVLSTGTGGITVSTTAAGTINSNRRGIWARSSGTAGNITVTTAGVIGGGVPVGGNGIEAGITNTASAGTISITANANVTSLADGISVQSLSTGGLTISGSGDISARGRGIYARQFNNAAGTNAGVHVGGTGDTAATFGAGISALITGANNRGAVLVDRTGNLSGTDGIVAITVGGGNVTVTGVGNVDGGAGTGINAASSGGNGNVVVAPAGSVTGAVGIVAWAAGAGTATVTVSNSVTGTGGTAIQLAGAGNTLALNSGYSITGNAIGAGSDTLQLGGAGSATFNSSNIGAGLQYQGFTTFNKNGTSTWTLTGGGNQAWNVQSGTLLVNGTSGAMTVGAGGVLGGNGTVGDTAINGGTLAPGEPTSNSSGPLAVQGNLSFTAASTYMIQVSSTSAGRTNVAGVATLGGATVNAVFAPGGNVTKQYTILNAAGGFGGIFNPAVSSNIANIQSTLSYDANNAFLNIKLVFVGPNGLNANQQNVANALSGFFNSTGSIPAVFATLGPGGLTQASGEAATGSQQATFNAMSQFMGVLTDPFVAGRGDAMASSGGAPGFAEESDGANAYAANSRSRPTSERDAYAAVYRKAPAAEAFAQRWSVWATGYGGSQTTDGNAPQGSNATTSRIYGIAVGADYRLSPFTLAGFSLAGGGTNFSIANGLGSGRSDLFQAGAFIRHAVGPAYISAALAYGWQDITTDRTVTNAGIDQLRARFNANAFSGRVEGGYRFVTQGVGLTPYAAGQFTTFELPSYAETAVIGANTFALGYAARNVTATRSELGLRSDKSFALSDAILTLRSRLAWAHDYNPDRNIAATFQTLPGASFVVNGAAQAADSALATVSAEMKWINGWSAAATFEGEFSNVTDSYAGRGVARYSW